MNIGNAIKKLRKIQKKTQETTAQKSKISQTYLSQIEHNHKKPNLQTLDDIAVALNVPLLCIFLESIEKEDLENQLVRENVKKTFNYYLPIRIFKLPL